MPLTGSAAFQSSTSLINVGSATVLDNMPQGTTLAWVRRTASVTDARVWQKAYVALHGAAHYFVLNDTGGTVGYLQDRTTDLQMRGGTTPPLNEWWFVVAQWNTAGSNGDQRIFTGNLTTPATEVSSYAVQIVGSGSLTSDAAAPLTIGNRQNGSVQLGGDMALLVITTALLSIEEIRDVQDLFVMPRGCVGYWRPGQQGLSTALDESGFGSHGTLTAVTLTAQTIYPAPDSPRVGRWKRALFPPAAGFNAAWARGSNAVYQPGVC